MPTIKVAISKVEQETPYVKRFTMVPTSDKPLPKFSGGSHITTIVEKEGKKVERSYSLTSSPIDSASYSIAIRKSDQSKGGSLFWHENMKVGSSCDISYPKNHFMLSFSAKHHLFFAAGIGITPFLTMMDELKRKGKTFELHYAARSREHCAFYDFLNEDYQEETHFYFSDQGHKMNPTLMEDRRIGSHVYFCGPEPMVSEFAEQASHIGYPESHIHYELFAAKDYGPKQPFEVKLAKSNRTFTVPADKELLDVLLENEIDTPHSCRIGGCGSCMLDVKSGEVDHRDSFLTEVEKQEPVILACVSRAKSNCLVINL